jgi:hypothetical protein
MAIEIVFGQGLGALQMQAEQTVLAHRSHIDLPETSLEAFAHGLHELLAGMAGGSADFVLSPENAEFYFLLIVSKPSLGLEYHKVITLNVYHRIDTDTRAQMKAPAHDIACKLADLGNPVWEDPNHRKKATLH